MLHEHALAKTFQTWPADIEVVLLLAVWTARKHSELGSNETADDLVHLCEVTRHFGIDVNLLEDFQFRRCHD